MKRLIIAVLLSYCSMAAAQMTTLSNFSVGSAGTAELNIPILVPPGTAGLEPKLSLAFNSSGGNGLLGMRGGIAGLSAITHCPSTLAQDNVRGAIHFDNNDRFCIDGQRLVAISGTYGADGTEYRTEVESFSKIISHGSSGYGPTWFQVWTKSGLVMEFGNTTDSRILAQGKATVNVWAVNKISDTTHNYITATYINDTTNGYYYPSHIDYTGNTTAGLTPNESVTFSYESRTDVVPMYIAGSLLTDTVRLTHVKTYVGTTSVRDYQVSYEYAFSTQRSRVTSITECSGDGTLCRPPITLEWQNGTVSFPTWTWNSTSVGASSGYADYFADVNGDGKDDLIQIAYATNDMYVGLSNGDGSFQLWTWHSTSVGSANDYDHYFADVNGDGKADMIQIARASNVGYVGLSNGDGSFTLWNWGSYSIGATNDYEHIFADVDGDGRADWIQIQRAANNGYVGLSNGDGSFPTWTWSSGSIGDANDYQHYVADVNGDGKADLIQVARASNVGWVGLSNGDGSFGLWNWGSYSIGAANDYEHIFADVNGDGNADWIQIQRAADNGYVGLSNGDGSFTTWTWSSSSVGSANSYSHYAVDINGDGRADLVQVLHGGNHAYIGLAGGNGSFELWTWDNTSIGDANAYDDYFADINGDANVDWIQIQKGANNAYTSIGGGAFPDLFTIIHSGIGATTTITYKALTDSSVYTKDSGGYSASYPVVDLQEPTYVVSAVSTTNGVGGNTQSTYSYAGLKFDTTGRGLLGFRQMESTQTDTGISVLNTFRQDFPFIGLASQTKKLSSVGTVLDQTDNTLTCNDFNSGCTVMPGRHYFPYISQTVESGHDLNGATLPTATTTYTYDSYGNATQVVSGTGDGYSKTTNNTFTNDTTNWLLGRMTGAQVTGTKP